MKRYIKQIDREDFVFPNNTKSTFDRRLIHEINNNYPTGTINGITGNTFSSTTLDFDVDWTYLRNSSKLFKDKFGEYVYVTFHILTPDRVLYKPWIYIGKISTTNPNITTDSQVTNFNLSPSDLGLTEFIAGNYFVEVRFIGKRCVYPVCYDISSFIPSPSPLPSPSPTPTPTVTPSVGSYYSFGVYYAQYPADACSGPLKTVYAKVPNPTNGTTIYEDAACTQIYNVYTQQALLFVSPALFGNQVAIIETIGGRTYGVGELYLSGYFCQGPPPSPSPTPSPTPTQIPFTAYTFDVKYGKYPVDVCTGATGTVYAKTTIPGPGDILYKDINCTQPWSDDGKQSLIFTNPAIYGTEVVGISILDIEEYDPGEIMLLTGYYC